MMLLRLKLLLCVSLWLFCKQGFASCYQEPLVQEGRSYAMNCAGNLSSTDWEIHWVLNNKTQISICDPSNVCYLKSKRFQAKRETNDTLVTSVLTIKNVSWEDRRQTIACLALERNNGTEKKTLGVWSISRSYLPPDPPLACQADLREGQIIGLSCHADKLYPDISCQPVQMLNGYETSLKIPMEYDKKPSNYQEYYSIDCRGVFLPYKTGAYTLCVNSTTAAQSNQPACTNTITVNNQTTVRIAHDTSTVQICPEEKHSMSIRCEILWWTSPEKPIVSCSVGDEVITNSNDVIETSHHTERQYSSFETFCNFIPTPKDNGKFVKCDVTARNLTQVFSGSTKISVAYHPSKPPLFVYKGYENTKQTTFPLATNVNVSVICTIEGGNSGTSNVTIECVSDFMSEGFKLSQKNKAELDFIFHNDTNCICTVEHMSHCVFNSATKLSFVKDIRSNSFSWTCLGFTCLKYFIAVGAVGFGVLCVSVLYWRACRRHSSRSFYSCFRCYKSWQSVSLHDKDTTCARNDSSNVTISEASPYLVVDIVNPKSNLHEVSNLSDHSFLSKHCQCSHMSHKYNPSPRRKRPPLPTSFSQKKTGKTTNEIDVISSLDSTNKTIDSHYNMLPMEQLPPLPPRVKLKANDQLLEIPLYRRSNLFSVTATLPNCQLHEDSVDRAAACCSTSNNSKSLPKRPLPPAPCSAKTQFTDNFVDALIERHDTYTHHNRCEDITNNAMAETTEPVSSARFQQLWPPPPFKARKQVCKTRHVRGKSKRRRYAAIENITPNPDANDERPDNSINTYINIKTQPSTVNENSSQTFYSGHCSSSEDDTSNDSRRAGDSDAGCSLSSNESRSSWCSVSTVIDFTRDCQHSQAEGAIV